MKTLVNKLEEVIDFNKPKFIVLASRPGMGKSTLALDIIENVSFKQNKPSLFFNLETSRKSLLEIISKKPNIFEDDITNAKLHIVDTPNLSIQKICDKCREMKLEYNIKFVFIDYIQLIEYDKSQCLSNNDVNTNISEILKKLADELDVHIFALSQLTMAPEHRENHRPILSDFGNNFSIVNNADVIMFLYRENYYNKNTDNNTTELIIAKNTNGTTKTIEI